MSPQKTGKVKSSPIGVRLEQDDLLFLKQSFPDSSPGEALRSVLQDWKRLRQQPSSIQDAESQIQAFLGHRWPIRSAEGGRSVVMEDIVREATLILAVVLISEVVLDQSKTSHSHFEALMVDRAFDLVDAVLRHVSQEQPAAWDPDSVLNRLFASRKLLASALATTAHLHLPAAKKD